MHLVPEGYAKDTNACYGWFHGNLRKLVFQQQSEYMDSLQREVPTRPKSSSSIVLWFKQKSKEPTPKDPVCGLYQWDEHLKVFGIRYQTGKAGFIPLRTL